MKPISIKKEVVRYASSRIRVKTATIEFPKRTVEWDYVECPDAVLALALDEKKNVYLVREWRVAWKKEVLQIPGGICFGTTEKARLTQLRNELREEIGMDSKKITKLATFYASAAIRLRFHVYLAENLYPSSKPADEGEYLEVIKMPFKKAYNLFVSGKELTPSSTLVAFLMAKDQI
jgi:ADP-ribose pyrophosphatase